MPQFHESAGPRELEPIDHVLGFLRVNDGFINSMLVASQRPNRDALYAVQQNSLIAKAGTQRFRETRFYEDGDPADRRTAIDAISVAIRVLQAAGTKLSPQEEWKEIISDTFTGDMAEMLEDEPSGVVTKALCDSYDEVVDDVMNRGFALAPSVQRFARGQEQRLQQKTRLNLGLCAAAGYIGFKLARGNKRA